METRRMVVMTAVLAVAVALLSSCQGNRVEVKLFNKSANPIEHIESLENDIEAERQNHLDVLAPISFDHAVLFLNKAKEGLKEGTELSEILKNVAYGKAHLQQALKTAQIAETALSEVIKARDLARRAGALGLGQDYQEGEKEFLELTRAIENNDLSRVRKNKARVANIFRHLELRAIKEQALSGARQLIQQAENEGAGKLVPKTFGLAQNKLAEAETFISENPYQTDRIQELTAETLFEAQRLLQVISQCRSIQIMQPEEITLQFEGMLHTIAGKFPGSDRRDQPFTIQLENILDSITRLQEDHKLITAQYEAQREEMESMRKQMASLEKLTREEQTVREQLTEIRSLFDPAEAEASRREHEFMILLKSIQFPVGQSVIMPGNYALLSKVQQCLGLFDRPQVVIEGHTDSSGTAKANKQLSQNRAEAVREYLLANGTLDGEKIAAVGYGSTRPLASNETAGGRAANRRINIIIKP